MISTRGRYAVRIMIDIAEHSGGEYVSLKCIADRQDISVKYMERIMPLLVKNGLVEGASGKGGGYRLLRTPDKYTVGEILRCTEDDLAPVACLECGAATCKRAATCQTLPMWREYYKMTKDYFDSVTVADLMKNQTGNDYII